MLRRRWREPEETPVAFLGRVASRENSVTVLGEAWELLSVSRAGGQIHQALTRTLRLVAALDLVMLGLALALAWTLRVHLGNWAVLGVPNPALAAQVSPWIVVLWVVFLAGQGAYARRLFGAGPEEFKAVAMASALAMGTTAMGLYLLKVEISRGFVLLVFCFGLSLLLGERYAVRKVVHRLREQGRLQHRVLVVGSPEAATELVDVLHRETYAGYRVIAACGPEWEMRNPVSFPVPLLGRVADVRSVCEEVGADTVLVAAGTGSSKDLRQIAWDLEGTEIDLVVVPRLTDVAGPRDPHAPRRRTSAAPCRGAAGR